jgi:uncharacterized protein YjbJ (UPF0337 family)
MDKDRIKGSAEQFKGKAKKLGGKMTGRHEDRGGRQDGSGEG